MTNEEICCFDHSLTFSEQLGILLITMGVRGCVILSEMFPRRLSIMYYDEMYVE